MKAWEILSNKDKWIKGCNARDKNGKVVAITDPDATCWCVVGAIFKSYEDNSSLPYKNNVWINILDRIEDKSLDQSNKFNHMHRRLMTWNDAPERTYEEVYSVLKELDI
jgi:hypothetical protein